jgi:glycosyltransferase involved in cell wall biosynthesis
VKVLLVSFYWPPAGGGGIQRPLKIAHHLPGLGIETHVLAPDDPKWIHSEPDLADPPEARVHRARYLGPKGRLPAQELRDLSGAARLGRRAALFPRRLLLPDESAPWALTAIPAAIRIVRRERIDVVLTTSPPTSVHLIGAAVARATGARWVADLRDSIVARVERRGDHALGRAKERAHAAVARLVARRADAVVAVTPTIAAQMQDLGAGRVEVIPNGSDFDDFDGLEHVHADRFRITHTGSFFAGRDARVFLRALADAEPEIAARFAGDFRTADRDLADELGVGDRLELIPYAPRRRALELQRDSEALLLLLPDVGERGRDVPSGKLFEYLAARRPILAAVPTDGAAAELVREAGAGIVVPPDDVDAIRDGLNELERRHRAGELGDVELPEALRGRLDRRTRVKELAELLKSLS